MLIARAHMQQLRQSQQLQQQSSSQRVGALSLVPFCLGIRGHPIWSRQGHARYTGARSAGRPWGGPNTVQHSSAVQKHGKHGSGAMSIQGKSVGSKRTVEESLLCVDGSTKRRTHRVDARGLPGAQAHPPHAATHHMHGPIQFLVPLFSVFSD